MAALLNAILLLVASGAIAPEAIQRFSEPSSVSGGRIIGIAAVGIAITTGSALMFMADRHNDLNIRGAFLHLIADAAVSLGIEHTTFQVETGDRSSPCPLGQENLVL